MKPLLLGGGVILLLLGLLLLVIALILYFAGRNKQPVAAAQYRPMPPQPPQPLPQQPLPPPPPPPPIADVIPPGAGDTDSTVVAERIGLGELHATTGPLAGQTFALKINGFYIGRDRTVSDIVIETPSVSKRHVWVGIRDGVPTAIDQNSTNGTYLNTLGTRIGTVRLTPGDTLIISDDVARFVYKA